MHINNRQEFEDACARLEILWSARPGDLDFEERAAMENAGRALVEEVRKERAVYKEEPGQENVGRVVPVQSGNAPKPPARPGKPKP